MSAIATERPVLSRQDIVNGLIGGLGTTIEGLRTRIDNERTLLDDPSETDREQISVHRNGVGQTIDRYDSSLKGTIAFRDWLGQISVQKRDYVDNGSILLLDEDGAKLVWILYDPRALRQGEEHYITEEFPALAKQLGVDEIVPLSCNCPVGEWLMGKTLAAGSKIEFKNGDVVNKLTFLEVI